MRRCLLLLALVGAMTIVSAQQPPKKAVVLALSKSVFAVKITDPGRQLQVFGSVLGLFDTAQELAVHAGAPNPGPLRGMVDAYVKTPGVNANGDLWFLGMPEPKDAGGNAAAPSKGGPGYVLVPLQDPIAFKGALAGKTPLPGNPGPRTQILGNLAIIASAGQAKPAFTEVKFDLTLATRREIAAAIQFNNLDAPTVPESMGPMAMFMAPVLSTFSDAQSNMKRVELGAAMVGADLSLETYTIPMPNSTLAKSLTTAQPSTLPLEYTAYLPENLAYCSAGPPMMPGAIGLGNMVLRTAFGLMAMFLPPERQTPFLQSTEALLAQCSQGRVLAFTAPPAGSAAPPSFLAIYHVTNALDAREAVKSFVKELALARDNIWGGALKDSLRLEMKLKNEQIGALPVDLLQLGVKPPAEAPAAGGQAAPAPQTFATDLRFAYLDDKMLLCSGPDGLQQLTAVLGRLQQAGQPSFVSSARFQAIKAAIPHRYPFLLIDQVEVLEEDKKAVPAK